MPYFSIIIPTYNRYEKVKKSIDSVLNQTLSDFELIVIDDGSTDETYKIEKKYKDKIIYLKQNNAGVSAARNKGINIAKSKYLAFLDSDDIWKPDKLKIQQDFIINNPHTKIHQTEEIWIRNNVRVNPKKKHKKISGDIFLPSLELCLISPSSVVMDRELIDTYGNFDESLPACEDYDLWLRISSFEKVGLIDDPQVIKEGGHEDQLSKKYWGMDRFRVYSILKLLGDPKFTLKNDYIQGAKKIALKKSEILLTGAQKRNKTQLAMNLKNIIHSINCEDYSNINYQSLLEE